MMSIGAYASGSIRNASLSGRCIFWEHSIRRRHIDLGNGYYYALILGSQIMLLTMRTAVPPSAIRRSYSLLRATGNSALIV
jgi:hypothetical protein